MRRARLLAIGVALMATAGAATYAPALAPRAEIAGAAIQDGDILLFKSWTWRSVLMRAAQPGSAGFGHAGVAYRDEGGRLSVVHADPRIRAPLDRDGVRSDVVEDLIDHYGITEVAVLRADDPALPSQAVSGALGALAAGASFDHEFDLADRSAIYCTELLLDLFPEGHFAQVVEASPYFMPDALLEAPGFSLIEVAG